MTLHIVTEFDLLYQSLTVSIVTQVLHARTKSNMVAEDGKIHGHYYFFFTESWAVFVVWRV